MKVIVLKTHAMNYSQGLYKRGQVVDMSESDVKVKAKRGLVKMFEPKYKTKEEKINLEDKTVKELRDYAKDKGIPLNATTKKEIIKQIEDES